MPIKSPIKSPPSKGGLMVASHPFLLSGPARSEPRTDRKSSSQRQPQLQPQHVAVECRHAAEALCKANEVRALRTCYDVWCAFVKQRQLAVHLKRCSTALKHSNNRQQYTRVFLRWLTAAQISASQEAKQAYVPPKDTPLRTKKDLVDLVARYFNTWRRHLREKRQRTCTNVQLLADLSEERARHSVFVLWIAYSQRKKSEAQAAHMDRLAAQQQMREQEVLLLQEVVSLAVARLNGSTVPVEAAHTEKKSLESSMGSLAHSRMLAKALEVAVQDTAGALPSIDDGVNTVEPLTTRLRALERHLSEAEAARQAAEAQLAAVNALLSAMAQMMTAMGPGSGDGAAAASALSTASVSGGDSSYISRPSSARGHNRSSVGAGGSPSYAASRSRRSDTASGPCLQQRSSQSSRSQRAARESSPADAARTAAEQAAQQLADSGDDRAQQLLADTVALLAGAKMAKDDLSTRAAEVTLLQDVASRAVEALGGRSIAYDTPLVSGVQGDDETPWASMARSRAIADSLGDLCEDMVVVLVLASLWSQHGASERVSESLERMWRALQNAEKDFAAERAEAEQVLAVVTGTAEMLGGGLANSATRSYEIVAAAKMTAQLLKDEMGQPAPLALFDRCQQLVEAEKALTAKVSDLQGLEEQNWRLQGELEAVQGVLKQRVEELKDVANTRDGLNATVKQAQNEGAKLKAAVKAAEDELQRLQQEVQHANAQTAHSEQQRQTLEGQLKDTEAQRQQLEKDLEILSEELQEAGTMLSEAEQAREQLDVALGKKEQLVAGLGATFDAVTAMLSGPQSPDAAAKALELAVATAESQDVEKSDMGTPVACVRAINHLNAQLHDAIQALPTSIAVTQGAKAGPDASVADLVDTLCSWKDGLLQDMQSAVNVYNSTDALTAFLRDVLRDVIHRLAQVRQGFGEDDSMLATRLSLALEPEVSPQPLVCGDPTDYVEYILRLQGIDEYAKRAVQDHLATSAVVGGGNSTAPCTWNVIADLHEHLAGLLEVSTRQVDYIVELREAQEQLSRANGVLRESLEDAQNVLQHWADSSIHLQQSHSHEGDGGSAGNDPQSPLSMSDVAPSLRGSIVNDFNSSVEAVVEALRHLRVVAEEEATALAADSTPPPVDESGHPRPVAPITITDLPTLVSTLTNMRTRLVDLQHTAEDGIAALGGIASPLQLRTPADGGGGTSNSTGGAGGGGGGGVSVSPGGERRLEVSQVEQRTIGERLAEICRDTGSSIQEAKQILGVPDTPGVPLTLRDVLPSIRAKIVELDEVRKDSEAFIKGLDNALNDEGPSSLNSSLTSRASKSLKAKKKPLPALEGSPTELMTMTHREFSTKRASEATVHAMVHASPQDRLNAMRFRALGKIDEVQDLRAACRAAINILDGNYVEGKKAPAYGEILVPLLLSQIEDIKKSLPLCEEALNPMKKSAYVSRKIGVAARLSTLAYTLISMQTERDNLREELSGKSRQSKILLDDINAQAERYRAKTMKLNEENTALKTANEALQLQLDEEAAHCRQTEADLEEDCAVLEEEVRHLHGVIADATRQLEEETAQNDVLTQRVAQRQHEKNVLTGVLAKALVDLEATSSSSHSKAGAKPTSSAADGDATPLQTVADTEAALLQQLTVEQGEGLRVAVASHVTNVRAGWQRALGQCHDAVAALQRELAQLRADVGNALERDFRSYCEGVVAAAAEERELLVLENDRLRSRALEREALLKEKKTLMDRLARAEAACAAAEEEATAAVAANDQLRKALREAEVEQVLKSIPANTRARAAAATQQQQPSVNIAELERRMIRGATTLTMEAIDSMAGENMAHIFGDVAARTVNMFRDVETCVSRLQGAFAGYEQAHNPHALAVSVDGSALELERIADAADQLWSSVPVLFQAPYSAGS